MDRVILHIDADSFYASIECLHHPAMRDLPVAVAGDVENRHGIILSKTYAAKKFKIKTGEAIWQAREKCPQLVVIQARFSLYLRFSKLFKDIIREYTDQVESFGIDETWADVTHSAQLYGGGEKIAHEISLRVYEELGITVSIGVSFNKIFAKLGSDLHKPNGLSVITKANFREIVWLLPAGDLLFVGRATARKLYDHMIRTIGDLANTDPKYLRKLLGKWGEILWSFANGYDESPVLTDSQQAPIKSIGNSTTAPRDLVNLTDIRLIMTVLADSVAARARENGLKGRTVSISVRDKELVSFTRQRKIKQATDLSGEIIAAGMTLFQENYDFDSMKPIRSLGVSLSALEARGRPLQLDLFDDYRCRDKAKALEESVDELRRRFGYSCIKRASLLLDEQLTDFNPKEEHVIHPVGFSQ